jgi:hypothetical protein
MSYEMETVVLQFYTAQRIVVKAHHEPFREFGEFNTASFSTSLRQDLESL